MRNILPVLSAGLLLLGCKNPKAPTPSEIGYVSNDLEELRKSPEEDPFIHYIFDQPIGGFEVSMDWMPNTEQAELHFAKEGAAFSITCYSFDPEQFDIPTDGTHTQLHYKPKPAGTFLYDREPFFFSDVDFDGVEELLTLSYMEGPHGTNAYLVYEPDGTEREDEPFDSLSDLTDFSPSEKAIIQNNYWGVLIGGNRLKYRRQQNGTFALTDSTFIEYTIRGDEMVDSIRVHYRRQGGKMVLVRKEVVR